MQLRVVGSSPAWPNPGSAQSGYLVEGAGGGRVLLDCGSGVLARLRALDGWPRVHAVVLTHYHLDHFGDLVPWVWGALFGPGRDARHRPELWIPPGSGAQLDHLGMHFWQADMFRLAFEVREYPEGEPFAAGGLELTATRVPHYELRAYGLAIRENGAVLAYSGDSAPCPQLAEVARGADLFLCEATLRSGTTDGDPRGHLTVEEAVDAWEASGAARLLLTHRPCELPLDEGLDLASDGLVVEVGAASRAPAAAETRG